MTDFETRLAAHISKIVTSDGSSSVSSPPQGMNSRVFFITLGGAEYAVKYGPDATKDVSAITMIRDRGVRVPTPEIVENLVFEGIPVLVMKRIKFPLLESVPVPELRAYLPSMVSVMKELHTVTNSRPQVLSNSQKLASWKDYLIAQFDGRTIDWKKVLERKTLDQTLIADALDKFRALLVSSDLELPTYALLHTDFNQRNLFVNPATKTVAAVIDWEDAVFGDPLYDFARIRMFLWHFNQPEDVIAEYYVRMQYTDKEKTREWLYWTARIIQYLAWYSEEDTAFNTSRIALHQDYLRAIRW